MDEEAISVRILKQLETAGADDVVVSASAHQTSHIKFSNNQVNAVKYWENTDLGIFMAMKKRIVVTTLKDISASAAYDAVTKLLKFVKSVQPNKDYAGIAHGPFTYRPFEESFDKKIETLGDKALDYVEKALAAADAHGAKRSAGVFENSTSSTSLMTSHGVHAAEKGTHAYFSIRSFTDKDASGQGVGCSRMLSQLDVERIAAEAAETACLARHPVQGAPGSYDVLFDYLPFANLIDTLGSSLSAFSVEAGLSCLKDMLGKEVAAPLITLADDGTLANGYGSSMFDAEGVPCQKTPVIEGGILRTYLHNTSTAHRFKTQTTANAGLLAPEPTNLVVSPGTHSRDELIAGVKDGIYITNVWYTRFQNYQTGDFSTIPRDGIFSIKNGRIGQPLKGIRVSDNLLRMFRSIAAVGREQRRILGWEVERPVVCPLALIRDVKITMPE